MADQGMDPGGAGTPDAASEMIEHARSVGAGTGGGGLDLLMNVELALTVELGRCRMKIHDIVNLGSGSVVELSKLASEPVDILVNDAVFARGEVVVMEDHFAVKITELADRPDLGQEG
jgi:flagellar motor switch protein FliN/FliY